jgi:hypothetical protein
VLVSGFLHNRSTPYYLVKLDIKLPRG